MSVALGTRLTCRKDAHRIEPDGDDRARGSHITERGPRPDWRKGARARTRARPREREGEREGGEGTRAWVTCPAMCPAMCSAMQRRVSSSPAHAGQCDRGEERRFDLRARSRRHCATIGEKRQRRQQPQRVSIDRTVEAAPCFHDCPIALKRRLPADSAQCAPILLPLDGDRLLISATRRKLHYAFTRCPLSYPLRRASLLRDNQSRTWACPPPRIKCINSASTDAHSVSRANNARCCHRRRRCRRRRRRRGPRRGRRPQSSCPLDALLALIPPHSPLTIRFHLLLKASRPNSGRNELNKRHSNSHHKRDYSAPRVSYLANRWRDRKVRSIL